MMNTTSKKLIIDVLNRNALNETPPSMICTLWFQYIAFRKSMQ